MHLPRHLSAFHVDRAPKLTKYALQYLPPGCTVHSPYHIGDVGQYHLNINEAYKYMKDELNTHFQDPDPRASGGDLDWV